MSTPLNAPSTAQPSRPDSPARTTSGSQEDSHRQAWAREMERAQSDAWFKGQSVQPRAAATSSSEGGPQRDTLRAEAATAKLARSSVAPAARKAAPSHDSPALARGDIREAVAPVHVAPASTSRPPRPAPFLAAPVMAPSFAMTGTVACLRHREDAYLGPANASRALPLDPPELLPARLHAEWQGDALRIWLGLDSALAEDSGHVVAFVTNWLRRQGLRASSIVCNGRTLLADPHAAEPPTIRQAGRDDAPTSTHLDIVATRSP